MMRATKIGIGLFALCAGVAAQSARVAEGIADFNRGDYAGARKVLAQFPSDETARTYLALTRAATGECDAVAPELERRFAAKGSADLRRLTGLALAQCRMAAKQFAAAGPVIAQLEKEFPADADVLYLSANFHMKAWNDAIYRMYQNAPGSFRADELSAEVFESQGRYADAIGEYRKAIAKSPNTIDLHYRLARAILQQSHDPAALGEALAEFQAELRLNPSDAAAEYQVGEILDTQQKKPDATQHFDRAVQLRPDFAEALIAVAKGLSGSKHYAEAIQLLERAVALQPKNETAHYNLMLAYRDAGRVADAQRESAEIEKLQKPPEGEFTDFLKRLGEKPAQ